LRLRAASRLSELLTLFTPTWPIARVGVIEMVLNLDGGVGIGLGYASVLLQLELGIGLVTAFFCTLAALSAQLTNRLEDVPWEATFRAAAAAASPCLLLVVFTLAQVKGGAEDIVTPVGLLVAEVAVFLGTLLVILGPLFGGEVPEVDVRTGDILSKSFEDGSGAATRYGSLARVLSACRALAQLMLLVAALPGGSSLVQLIFASGLARLALFVQALLGIANALAVEEGPFMAACTDVARTLSVVPFISGLTLLELSLWGPSSVMLMPLDPAVWCGFAVVAQVALILVVRFGLGGTIEEKGQRDFDFLICVLEDDEVLPGANRLTLIQNLLRAVYYLPMAALILKILVGTYTVTGSLSGLCVQWGDPLTLTASSLAVITYFSQILDFAAPDVEPMTNGALDEAEDEAEDEVGPSPGISEPLKVITNRAPGLLLACIVAQMTAEEAPTLLLSLRYSFVLVLVAIGIQIAMLVTFAVCNCDVVPAPEPPLDASGSLNWEALGVIRAFTMLLLQGGLLLGCMSLGVLPWLVIGCPLFLIIYLCSPAEAKEVAQDILSVLKSTFLSRLEAYLEKRREAAQAAAAKRAAERKAAEERMMAEWAQNEKASKSKMAATSEQKKAPVEKTAAGKAAAGKAKQDEEEDEDEPERKSKKKGGAKSKGGKKKK